jgi:aspartyl-tRNA(Asn)/glutamyl-tRNA(Gln) amidotransferase subunit C
MSLDKTTVRRIARLARLGLDEAQAEPMTAELNNILKFVEQLNEVNIEGVAPMAGGMTMGLKMRDDKVTEGGDAAAILRNAPATEAGFFVVPKVVE